MVNHQTSRGCREEIAGAQLVVLEELSAEVRAVHLSLAENRLAAFCEGISRLEDLCAQWQGINSAALRMRSSPIGAHESDGPGRGQVIAAKHQLFVANCRLATLVRHCRRSAGLLANLYYATFHEPGSGAASPCNVRSWSSEA